MRQFFALAISVSFIHAGCTGGLDPSGDGDVPGDGDGAPLYDDLGPVYVGDLDIEDSGDLDNLLALIEAGVTTIDGDLRFSGALAEASVPGLREVTGELTVESDALLLRWALPDLTTVGQHVIAILAGRLEAVSLPSLISVDGNLVFVENVALTSLDLEDVTTVGGDLSVENNDGIGDLDLGSLTTVSGNLRIFNEDALPAILLPRVEEVGGDLILAELDGAAEIDLDALTSVGGELQFREAETLVELSLPALVSVGDFGAYDDRALRSVEAPQLESVSTNVFLAEDGELILFAFPSLAHIGGVFGVENNPSLPQCLVDAFASSLPPGQPMGGVIAEGNNDLATCP